MDKCKFRVFDNDDKKMHDVIEIMFREDNTVVEWLNSKHKKRRAFIDEVPVFQCTGLKDNKGTMIYEGDIVTFEKASNDKLRKGVVKYYKNYCHFYVQVEENNWARPFNLIPDRQYLEVVGNMYENEELLNG